MVMIAASSYSAVSGLSMRPSSWTHQASYLEAIGRQAPRACLGLRRALWPHTGLLSRPRHLVSASAQSRGPGGASLVTFPRADLPPLEDSKQSQLDAAMDAAAAEILRESGYLPCDSMDGDDLDPALQAGCINLCAVVAVESAINLEAQAAAQAVPASLAQDHDRLEQQSSSSMPSTSPAAQVAAAVAAEEGSRPAVINRILAPVASSSSPTAAPGAATNGNGGHAPTVSASLLHNKLHACLSCA